MNHEQLIEAHNLITNFMGVRSPIVLASSTFYLDWISIMAVVEKIESMGYTVIIQDNWCGIRDHGSTAIVGYDGGGEQKGSKLLAVFEAVVEFLKKQ